MESSCAGQGRWECTVLCSDTGAAFPLCCALEALLEWLEMLPVGRLELGLLQGDQTLQILAQGCSCGWGGAEQPHGSRWEELLAQLIPCPEPSPACPLPGAALHGNSSRLLPLQGSQNPLSPGWGRCCSVVLFTFCVPATGGPGKREGVCRDREQNTKCIPQGSQQLQRKGLLRLRAEIVGIALYN